MFCHICLTIQLCRGLIQLKNYFRSQKRSYLRRNGNLLRSLSKPLLDLECCHQTLLSNYLVRYEWLSFLKDIRVKLGSAQRSNRLTFYVPCFTEKVPIRFIYLFFDRGYPSHILIRMLHPF